MERRVLIDVLLVDQSEVLLLLVPGLKDLEHLETPALGGHVVRGLVEVIAQEKILTGVKGDKTLSETLESAELSCQVKRSGA